MWVLSTCVAAIVISAEQVSDPSRRFEIRAAILYLVSDGFLLKENARSGCPQLYLSLNTLQQNFLNQHPYPVYLFHTRKPPPDWTHWRHELIPPNVNVTWLAVPESFDELPDDFVPPEHDPPQGYGLSCVRLFTAEVLPLPTNVLTHTMVIMMVEDQQLRLDHGRPVGGYHYMMRFWWEGVLEVPEVKELEYYARMDTDSFILEPLTLDIFATMQDNNYKYGYRAIWTELHVFIEGFEDFAEEYMRKHPETVAMAHRNNHVLSPRDERDAQHLNIYYNNFEILHVRTFSEHPGIREFMRALGRTNNMFYKRWGDHIARTFACRLHLPPEEMHRFDFSYYHQGMYKPGKSLIDAVDIQLMS